MSLPSGYKKLEYIQSTGTQYIDTLVNIEANKPITLRVVCDCSFNNAGVGNGVGTTISGNIFYFGTYNGSYCYGLGKVDGVTSVAADTERRIHDLDAVGKKLTISGKLSLTGLSFATPTASRTFWLPQWGQGIKLYSCQIYDNGTLVRDFIPCQTTDGTIGLWDDVNSVFYGNAGTGTFTAGPEIKGANKTLIDGTGYDVKAGKCLVGGTAYTIKKGRTLIDGTAFTISLSNGIPLNTITPGAILYLNESGSPVPFYIAKHDYESGLNGAGRTLIVRKDCYDNHVFGSINTYANSSLDTWLCNTWIKLMDASVQTKIGTTRFYYTVGGGDLAVKILQRAVFQLSVAELGRTISGAEDEGSELPISIILETAYRNGAATIQWTRTPSPRNIYIVYGFDETGAPKTYRCTSLHGARPAFTLPATTAVIANPDGTYTLAA